MKLEATFVTYAASGGAQGGEYDLAIACTEWDMPESLLWRGTDHHSRATFPAPFPRFYKRPRRCLKWRDRKTTGKDIKKFVKQTDSAIAQVIGQRNGLDVKVTKTTEEHDLVVQKNQDDAQFLMERAKRIDFDCFVQTDPDSGKDTLYFVKPSDGRSSDKIRVYEFEWGKNLITFSPQLTISRQVSKVTVRGWSAELKDVFTYTADSKDLPGGGGKGTSGPEAAEKELNGKQEVVVDAPVTTRRSEEVGDQSTD